MDDKYHRCHRLKKQCRSSDSVRKTANAKRRQNSAARIGVLEEKFDSVVQWVVLPKAISNVDLFGLVLF